MAPHACSNLMGRPSAAAKRRKRFNQKVKRKLFAPKHENNASANNYGAKVSGSHSQLEMEDTPIQEQGDVCFTNKYTTSTNSSNKEDSSCSHADDEASDNCLGEDIDVVLMKTEDSLIQLECEIQPFL